MKEELLALCDGALREAVSTVAPEVFKVDDELLEQQFAFTEKDRLLRQRFSEEVARAKKENRKIKAAKVYDGIVSDSYWRQYVLKVQHKVGYMIKPVKTEEDLMRENLPHLYFDPYQWQKDFIDSKNKINLLCAANQVGKTASLIVKNIRYATEIDWQAALWPNAKNDNRKITQFWYFYPDAATLNREFEEKWKKEWLPRGKYATEGKWAWKSFKKGGNVDHIDFIASGITIYFFTYTQNPAVFQASTVFMATVDEELPIALYPEINARLTDTDGYFNMGFTATLGQDEWRRAMEEVGNDKETFPTAYKKCVSLYDCQVKVSGKLTKWTNEKIQEKINSYPTHNEVLKRVFGRFVCTEGLKFPQYDTKRHFVVGHFIPADWHRYAAIDPGSGGKAHPAGIVFLAVDPSYTKGRIYKCWRGDGKDTSSSDILEKLIEMKGNDILSLVFYDFAARDLFIVASRMHIVLTQANKKKDDGEGIVNSLFKNDMLKIYYSNEHDESFKLNSELMSLRNEQGKTNKRTLDNLADPLRYVCVSLPWDFASVINKTPIQEVRLTKMDKRAEIREKQLAGDKSYLDEGKDSDLDLFEEVSYWNSEYNNDGEDF